MISTEYTTTEALLTCLRDENVSGVHMALYLFSAHLKLSGDRNLVISTASSHFKQAYGPHTRIYSQRLLCLCKIQSNVRMARD
jgi:hypothetical protein